MFRFIQVFNQYCMYRCNKSVKQLAHMINLRLIDDFIMSYAAVMLKKVKSSLHLYIFISNELMLRHIVPCIVQQVTDVKIKT